MTYPNARWAQDSLNLILKFQLAGDARLHVKGAARMKLDGRGGLAFYDAETGTIERIELRDLQSFCVQQVVGAGQGMTLRHSLAS
jgi:hypothetical protein